MRGPVPIQSVVCLALLVLGLLASLPAADAQGPAAPTYLIEIDARYDPAPIMPIRETRAIDLEVRVRCDSPGLEPGLAAKQVKFDVRTDRPWFIATLSKTTEYFEVDPQTCVDGHEHIFSASAAITVSKDAPAFDPADIAFTASLDDGTKATEVIQLRAGFYEKWQARVEKSVVKGAEWEVVTVPLVIESFGNGPIQVDVRVHEESSKYLLVSLPGPQTVPSLIAGGETNQVTIPIDVRLPDDGPRMDQLRLQVEGRSSDDTAIRLTPVHVAAVFHTDGTDSDTPPTVDELPGPGVLFVPLVAGGLAWVARRRA